MEWEYTCEIFDSVIALSQQLNKLGRAGWDVIAVIPQTETMPSVIIAKRSKEKAWNHPDIAAKGE
jgi:hypothetical protein